MSAPRRVCLATTFYPPFNFGGDGIFVARLARALARRGVEVHVVHEPAAYRLLAGGDPPPRRDAAFPGIVEHPLPAPRRPRLALLAAHQRGASARARDHLERVVAEVRPDLLHFHNVSLLGGPDVLRVEAPTRLVSLHDYWFVCPTHSLWRFEREACERPTCLACTLATRRPPQLWRWTGAIARAVRGLDAVLVPSEFSRRRHAALGEHAPLEVLPLFAEQPPAAAAAPGPPYFLFAGRLEPLKGIADLVAAFRDFRGAELHVAGDGSLAADLRRAAADLPHVRFLGALTESEVATRLRDAVAAVIPSRCFETFCLVGAEALAAGTPVVARRIGALAELVEPDGTGIAYETPEELRAALARMLEPAERARFAARARESFHARYSEERHVERYFAIAARAAARHGR